MGIFKRIAKALIRLRVCAGWSEPLLVAHTTLLEILYRGSIIMCMKLHRLIHFVKQMCGKKLYSSCISLCSTQLHTFLGELAYILGDLGIS